MFLQQSTSAAYLQWVYHRTQPSCWDDYQRRSHSKRWWFPTEACQAMPWCHSRIWGRRQASRWHRYFQQHWSKIKSFYSFPIALKFWSIDFDSNSNSTNRTKAYIEKKATENIHSIKLMILVGQNWHNGQHKKLLVKKASLKLIKN